MASKADVIRIILTSLPTVLDGSKELMQSFKKAKIDDEEVKAALQDLLDQKKELEELRLEIRQLKHQMRNYFVVTVLVLATLLTTAIFSLL